MAKAQIVATEPELVSDGAIPKDKTADKYEALLRWVLSRCEQWRLWRDSNYSAKWTEYERLWRGIWSSNERLRDSERSRIVTPALSEAVENAAAEVEEAVFGRGADYFDIMPYSVPEITMPAAQQAPGMAPAGGMAMMEPGLQGAPMPQAGPMAPAGPPMGAPMEPPVDPAQQIRREIEKVRGSLREDLARSDFAANSAKCILNAAVYGSGIGEIVVKETTIKTPNGDKELGIVRADAKKRTVAKLRPVHPRNFLYDPLAESIDEGLGVAIEEIVSKHVVLEAQKTQKYRTDIELCHGFVDDSTLYGDQEGDGGEEEGDKVHQLRYYGLVPKRLLNPKEDEGKSKESEAIDDEDELVEAVVVIINKTAVAKAVRNPYSMQDRPVVLFPWDVVPGRLMGRGICEKGANAQKILDAEVRARLDSLALVTAPMLGIDANRVPRGAKFEVRPGKTFLTNGRPSEIMEAFKFGQLDPNHWQNYESLKAMVQQATGSLDAAAMAGNARDARSGAMSMAMAPIIKRYKRTLTHFLDLFLMPALEKITWRHMQYQPERYPAVPLKFRAASTMGIMQREYETSQLTSLLATLEPGTAEHRAILTGIVANTSIPNREQVLELIAAGEERERVQLAMAALQQQDPQMQALQQAAITLELREKEAKIAELESQARLNDAKATETGQMAEMQAISIATKGIYAVPEEQQAAEFDRRYKMAQLALKEADLNEKRADRVSNERITNTQMQYAAMRDVAKMRSERADKREQRAHEARIKASAPKAVQ